MTRKRRSVGNGIWPSESEQIPSFDVNSTNDTEHAWAHRESSEVTHRVIHELEARSEGGSDG
jgi:hypothetical protein